MLHVVVNERKELPSKDLKQIIQRDRTIISQFQQVYEDGVRSGEFVNTHPVVTARVLLGACNAIAIWYRMRGDITPDELAHFVTRLLANGYLAKKAGRVKIDRKPESKETRLNLDNLSSMEEA